MRLPVAIQGAFMKRVLPILLLSALLLTGCNGDDNLSAEDTSTESTTTAAVSDSSSERTAKDTENNISPTEQTTTTAKNTETTADSSDVILVFVRFNLRTHLVRRFPNLRRQLLLVHRYSL